MNSKNKQKQIPFIHTLCCSYWIFFLFCLILFNSVHTTIYHYITHTHTHTTPDDRKFDKSPRQ